MQMGTTTRAAAMLNTTQPSVSRRIAELQSATELKLFDLHQGRLRPTSEGKLLYKTIQKHFDGLERIESVAAIMRKSGTGVLRLASTPTLAVGLLPRVVNKFLQKFPNTYFNIQTLSTQQLVDYLHQDLIDLAFTTAHFDQHDFQPVLIHKSNAVCVMPFGHPLSSEPVITLRMLKGLPLLSLNDTDELAVKIRTQLQAHHIPDDFIIETTSSLTICSLVIAGTGIGIVNPYVASAFSSQLQIKALSPAIDTSVQMAMPAHTAPSLLAHHFIDTLKEHVGTI